MRLPRVLPVLAVLAAVLPFAGPTIAAGCECDSPYVRHHGGVRHKGSVIRVYPTNHDDTANLLWATGFVGTLKGAGADKTILSNPGPLKVADDVIMNPPSASNLCPRC